MRLTDVRILNFRSIENLTINFDSNCRILVGKNESGKSNILKALSLLNDDNPTNSNDLRESLPEEPIIKDGYVRFEFILEPDEMASIIDDQLSVVAALDVTSLINVKTKLSLIQFFKSQNSGFYQVNFPKELRCESNWGLVDNYELPPCWKKPITTAVFPITIGNTTLPLNKFELINIDDFTDIQEDFLESVTLEYLNECIGKRVAKYLKDNKPETIFWFYNDKYLLPSSIGISEFSSDPKICLPLKYMFHLAGIEDIATSIKEAQLRNKQGLRNLFERVAKLTTEHFRKVWQEYKFTHFELNQNGTLIEASIKDSFNRYELAQRSDGFKRFVSFLLLISAKVEKKIMTNALILFDEPDLGLHPSGQRFLRDEIIRISKNNYVVYSSHSIFMIDKENVSRHLLVLKVDETTKIDEVNESNALDEEVIYNALGYSIFEILKNKNIIFEGWKDKKLFNLALSRVSAKYADVKQLKEYGLCHAKGVKDVKNIANILELANRNYLIISDSDTVAKEKQKEFKELRMQGEWKRYDEISNDVDILTSEDYIKVKCIVNSINQIKMLNEGFPQFDEEDFTVAKPKLTIIENKLRDFEPIKDNRKKIVEEIKNAIFENLKQSDIEDNYYDMLMEVAPLLK